MLCRNSMDTQLVDYFSPEFNLRIGDIFTKSVKDQSIGAGSENGGDSSGNQLKNLVEEVNRETIK